MDDDLNTLTRDQLIEEVKKLRNGIRATATPARPEPVEGACTTSPGAQLWGPLPEKTGPAAHGAGMAGVHPRLRKAACH